jgi:hypothetical protein
VLEDALTLYRLNGIYSLNDDVFIKLIPGALSSPHTSAQETLKYYFWGTSYRQHSHLSFG